MKRLLVIAAATLTMAACVEGPTAPAAAKHAPKDGASLDFSCSSGYIIAYNQDGEPYCEPVEQGHSAGRIAGVP